MPYFKMKEIFFMFLNKIHVVSNMPRLKPRFGVRYIASSQTWEGILHFGLGLHDGYYDNWLSQFLTSQLRKRCQCFRGLGLIDVLGFTPYRQYSSQVKAG